MQTNELQKALSLLVSSLAGLEIPYYIGGSVASSIFGLPRSTMDVDIVADIKKSHVKDLTVILQNDYYIDPDVIIEAIERKSSFNLIHFDTMMKIDIFILKDRPFDREAFKRKKIDSVGEEPDIASFYFSSEEDIIISKLEWYKLGGEVSERQWKDLIGVLKIQGKKLDFNYLKKWAGDLGLSTLLDNAINEAGDSGA
jgi:hypothetical protein